MTPEDKAHDICRLIEKDMRRLGITTTAHYESGVRLIAAAIREAKAQALAAAADPLSLTKDLSF